MNTNNERGNSLPPLHGLYFPISKLDSRYHGLYFTNCGALTGMRNVNYIIYASMVAVGYVASNIW